MHAQTTKPRMFKVLIPIEKKNGGGTFWMRVGTGFTAKDQTSLNLIIDAMPTGDNKLFHVREMDEEDFHKGGRADRRVDHELPAATAGGDELPF